MKFSLVVCGGTFDHFHKGHEVFLQYVFSVGERVIVGVTSDEYIKKLKIKNEKLKVIENFEKRKNEVLEFVKKEGVLDKTEIVEINDLFGPTLAKNLPIDAIVVSQDTKNRADIINKRRKELGLKELNLLIASQVLAQDGKIISSSRIRNGEINRDGRLWLNPQWLHYNLILTEQLRGKLRKPFGRLIGDVGKYGDLNSPFLITVGDVTTKMFNKLGLNQNISVIDFRIARRREFSSLSELGFSGLEKIIKVSNPAGSITSDLFRASSQIFRSNKGKKHIVIQINGEEDLSVLPLALSAPLGSLVFYGQPGKGIVRVDVSEESKARAYDLMDQFKLS